MGLTEEDRKIIRDLSKTIYDVWVTPPPIDTLTHLIKFEPKNYSTVSLEELADFIMGNLIKNEPLILKLSEINKKLLIISIMRCFGDASFVDLENGGDGMINPPFMEIISFYIMNKLSNMLNQGNLKLIKDCLLCI